MTSHVEGVVVQVSAAGFCEVVTANQIAVAFTPPGGLACRVDDRIRFTGLLEGGTVQVENVTRGWSAQLPVGDDDVHDLRLPNRHGARRTPDKKRLAGD